MSCAGNPCLEPCDPRQDCCCDRLRFEAHVVHHTKLVGATDCVEVEALVFTWHTPIPQCVLERCEATLETELTFLIHLYCPALGDEGADLTITGDDISAGTASVSREELGLPDCEPCIDDLHLEVCLTVRHGDRVVLRCHACPRECGSVSPTPDTPDTPTSPTPDTPDTPGTPDSPTPDTPDTPTSPTPDTPDTPGTPDSPTPDSPGGGDDGGDDEDCTCTITGTAGLFGACVDGVVSVGVTAHVNLGPGCCATQACAGFLNLTVNGTLYLGANDDMEWLVNVACTPGSTISITVTYEGTQGAAGAACSYSATLTA